MSEIIRIEKMHKKNSNRTFFYVGLWSTSKGDFADHMQCAGFVDLPEARKYAASIARMRGSKAKVVEAINQATLLED